MRKSSSSGFIVQIRDYVTLFLNVQAQCQMSDQCLILPFLYTYDVLSTVIDSVDEHKDPGPETLGKFYYLSLVTVISIFGTIGLETRP
jgi:hypothetical protein